jgi:phage gp36-like protein
VEWNGIDDDIVMEILNSFLEKQVAKHLNKPTPVVINQCCYLARPILSKYKQNTYKYNHRNNHIHQYFQQVLPPCPG